MNAILPSAELSFAGYPQRDVDASSSAQHQRQAARSAGWALAFVAEMAQRRLGLRPYPTQLLAAWLMLDGRLAEMATGEGKSLSRSRRTR
jgi:preprotein translocase subunit SecA